MSASLSEKKLLILGANAETIPIVEKAKKLGVVTYVTDNIPHSAAKDVADVGLDIDGKNVGALAQVIAKERIDGVMLGVADPLSLPYAQLCKAAGLPCCIDEAAVASLMNKSTFRLKCREVKIPTIPSYSYQQVSEDIYPVVVKPVRGRGGIGVSFCINDEMLESAYREACLASDTGEAMIEKKIEGKDCSAYFWVENNRASLLSLSERHTVKKADDIGTVTFANVFKTLDEDDFRSRYKKRFEKLILNIGMKTGLFTVQMLMDSKGDYYPYDPTCIVGGDISGGTLSCVTGYDVVENLIAYALTGTTSSSMDIISKDRCPQQCSAAIWILLDKGKIGAVLGMDAVRTYPWVLNCIQRMDVGDIVTDKTFRTEKACIARVWIKAGNKDELTKRMKEIRDTVRVLDESGRDMIYE